MASSTCGDGLCVPNYSPHQRVVGSRLSLKIANRPVRIARYLYGCSAFQLPTNSHIDVSISCTLSTTELHERKTTILASLRNAVLHKTRIPGGYRYEFASHSTTLKEVARMIEL